jgi:hypothetical protein
MAFVQTIAKKLTLVRLLLTRAIASALPPSKESIVLTRRQTPPRRPCLAHLGAVATGNASRANASVKSASAQTIALWKFALKTATTTAVVSRGSATVTIFIMETSASSLSAQGSLRNATEMVFATNS